MMRFSLLYLTGFLLIYLSLVLNAAAQKRLENINCSIEPQKSVDGFRMPVENDGGKIWHISNPFGNRVTNKDIADLPGGIWQHTGDDFLLINTAGSQSQPIYAIGDGVVVFSTKTNKNPNAARGGLVIIRHRAPAGSKFVVSQYDGAAGKYAEFETAEIYSYYLHLNPDAIFVGQNEQIAKGQQIARLYNFAEQKKKNLAYPPHLHLEIWSTCGKADNRGNKLELNGYEPDKTLKDSLKNPVIDPESFLRNVRITPKTNASTADGNSAPIKPRREEVPLPLPFNVALGKPVYVTTNGANEACDYCEKNWADITDGSLAYESEGYGRIADGCIGWQNNDYNELMEVTVTIDLNARFKISRIRYNQGDIMRAETWNADYMSSPFGRTATVPGANRTGRWTEQTGALTASRVTLTFQKTRTDWTRDWLFIGEIQIIGIPAGAGSDSEANFWEGEIDPRNLWQKTGFAVRRGEKIQVTAAGTVTWDPTPETTGGTVGPNGASYQAFRNRNRPWAFPAQNAGAGSLIMRIGKLVYAVGESAKIRITGDGEIEFMVNDDTERLFDNSGFFTVRIQKRF